RIAEHGVICGKKQTFGMIANDLALGKLLRLLLLRLQGSLHIVKYFGIVEEIVPHNALDGRAVKLRGLHGGLGCGGRVPRRIASYEPEHRRGDTDAESSRNCKNRISHLISSSCREW